MIRVNTKRTKLIRLFKRDLYARIVLRRRICIIRDFLFNLVKKKKKVPFYKRFYRVGIVEKPIYLRRRTKWCKYFFLRQKFRVFYGFLRISVLKKIIKKSLIRKSAVNFFIYLMESRLDVLLYRLNLAVTIRMSRQYVIHGKVTVNGTVIRNPSYNLKKNDVLSVKLNLISYFKKKIYLNMISNNLFYSFIPSYIEYSLKNLSYKIGIMNTCNDVIFFYPKSNRYSFLNIMNFYNKFLF